MSDSVWPIGFALFAWWFGTGLVFLLERGTRGRPTAAIIGMVALGSLSLYGVGLSSADAQPFGAYLGFASSIGLWGALELSFLSGMITGPRRHACRANCHGWRHFAHGVMALLYHELALAAGAAAVVALCWNQHNPTAACTYGVLWVMRESAKLNLFLGVRNTAVELLPRPLAHLACYFGAGRINALLPVSLVAGAVVDTLLVQQALAADATPQIHVARLLLATLLGLAILEHIVLILPIPADVLWTWATRRKGKAPATTVEPTYVQREDAEIISANTATALCTVGPVEAKRRHQLPPAAVA